MTSHLPQKGVFNPQNPPWLRHCVQLSFRAKNTVIEYIVYGKVRVTCAVYEKIRFT